MERILKQGFLGYDASLMLDVVVTALVIIVPWLLYSLYLVKIRRNFKAHKQHQIAMSVVLLGAVLAFEVDMQLHGGWLNIVNKNPADHYMAPEHLVFVRQVLGVHLLFAISTPLLWLITLFQALARFKHPPQPGTNRWHKLLGWISVVDLVCTSLTGLAFYYFAFVSRTMIYID